MKIPFRQGVVQYQTDTNRNQNFLQQNGATVRLYVSPTPTIVTFAHKKANYTYTEGLTIEHAWTGPFAPGTDYWLYWDLNPLTGVRTFGHTTLVPITGSTVPVNPAVGQHWFDTVSTTMRVWNGHIWAPVIRVFAAKYASAAIFQNMSNHPVLFSGTQVNDRSKITAGALLFDTLGKPLKASDGTFFTSATGAAVSGLASAVNFASIMIEAEAQVPVPGYSFVHFTDFNKIALSNPHTADTLPYGMVEIDLVQGMITNVITTGTVVNDRWNWSTINQKIYIAEDGSATTTQSYGSQTSVGFVIDRNAILLHQTATNISGGVGNQGPQGIQGEIGPQGIQGEIGPQGIQGEIGPQGIQGPIGLTGDTGPQGLKGDTGDIGPQGIQGPPGSGGTSSCQSTLVANPPLPTVPVGAPVLTVSSVVSNLLPTGLEVKNLKSNSQMLITVSSKLTGSSDPYVEFINWPGTYADVNGYYSTEWSLTTYTGYTLLFRVDGTNQADQAFYLETTREPKDLAEPAP